MLDSYDISVLISIDAYAPEATTAALKNVGIKHINKDIFHIEDFFDKDQLPTHKLKDITDKIREYENKGEKVAIHCGAGDGRSGTVKSAYVLDKIVSSQLQANTLTDEIDNIITHYNQEDLTAVIKSVSDVMQSKPSEMKGILMLSNVLKTYMHCKIFIIR